MVSHWNHWFYRKIWYSQWFTLYRWSLEFPLGWWIYFTDFYSFNAPDQRTLGFAQIDRDPTPTPTRSWCRHSPRPLAVDLMELRCHHTEKAMVLATAPISGGHGRTLAPSNATKELFEIPVPSKQIHGTAELYAICRYLSICRPQSQLMRNTSSTMSLWQCCTTGSLWQCCTTGFLISLAKMIFPWNNMVIGQWTQTTPHHHLAIPSVQRDNHAEPSISETVLYIMAGK